jgi:hypothetical protein
MNHNNVILRFPCHIRDKITQSLSSQKKNNPPINPAQNSIFFFFSNSTDLGIPNPNKKPKQQKERWVKRWRSAGMNYAPRKGWSG